jgi:hypothetical protein
VLLPFAWCTSSAGILFTTFISWIPGHTASFLGDNPQVPGESRRAE